MYVYIKLREKNKMGLDMYLIEEIYVGAKWGSNTDDEKVKFTVKRGEIMGKEKVFEIPLNKISTVRLEVGYWRKANQIHNWFIENCGNDIDDCRDVYVSREDLLRLKETCEKVLANHDLAGELLPTADGFFFGGTEYDESYFWDLENTIKILNAIDLSRDNTNDFFYHASW